MRKTEILKFPSEKEGEPDICIIAKELTVGEIRTWLEATKSQAENIDVVGELLVEGVSLNELQTLTDANPTVLNALYQHELEQVVAKARALNPFFFGLRGRLLGSVSPSVKPA